MNFKKLLTMLTITFFASSGTMATINIQGSNTKLIKNSLINNHESFSKLKGTSGWWPNKKLVYFIKIKWEIKLSFLIVKQL